MMLRVVSTDVEALGAEAERRATSAGSAAQALGVSAKNSAHVRATLENDFMHLPRRVAVKHTGYVVCVSKEQSK
jgi:hypothetical protein